MTRAQRIRRSEARAMLGAARALTRLGRHAEASAFRRRASEILATLGIALGAWLLVAP